MRSNERIKELNRKIEKNSHVLLQSIRSRIEKKCKELCSSADHSLRREKEALKKKCEKLIKRMDEKREAQNVLLEKMRKKVDHIDATLKRFENSSSFVKLNNLKENVERMMKQQAEKYERMRSDQRKIYKNEFEKLRNVGETIVNQNNDKMKAIIE